MRIIEEYVESFKMELYDAKDYAEKYLYFRAHGVEVYTTYFFKMASDELEHAEHLKQVASDEFEKLGKVCELSEQERKEWGKACEEYDKSVVIVRQMLNM